MAMAIGSHIGPPPIHRGSNPPIVVAVVNKIGRKRRWAASIIARAGSKPCFWISIRIRSKSTIALFTTMPANETIPRRVRKPKYDPPTIKPKTTPINPSGMVTKIIIGRRIELNWITNKRMIIKKAIGSFSPMAALAFPENSISPPSSYL